MMIVLIIYAFITVIVGIFCACYFCDPHTQDIPLSTLVGRTLFWPLYVVAWIIVGLFNVLDDVFTMFSDI